MACAVDLPANCRHSTLRESFGGQGILHRLAVYALDGKCERLLRKSN